MAWLGTWANRVEITLDNTNIDSDLTNFPVLVKLGHCVGQSDQDLGCVFDELTTSSLKIAATDEDGTTQLYIDVEKWDNTVPEAFLWVSSSTFVLHSDRATRIFLYYDSAQDDNTTYVGASGGTPAQSVWDSSYVLVDHMQDAGDTSSTFDSTSNDNDGTKDGAAEPIEATGKIGDAQDYDGANDALTYSDAASIQNVFDSGGALEAIVYAGSDGEGSAGRIGDKVAWYLATTNEAADKVKLTFWYDFDGAANGTWATTATEVDINTYAHIVVTYDNSAVGNNPVIYVNGDVVALTESTTPIGTRVADAGSDLDVGNDAATGATFDGIIDEFRLSDATRSAAWAKAAYYTSFDNLATYDLGGDWLSGWKQRVAVTIDSSKVDSNLTHFPVMIRLSGKCGASEQDLTRVFDEVGVEDQKIAVTDSTGVQQLYVEVEKWDNTNKEAILWVSRSDWVVSSSEDTAIYLYYDADKDDNTYFVDVQNSTPAERVWDSYFKLVQHMQDGASNAATYDSTSNDNDGAKTGANEPVEAVGKIGDAEDFDGTDDKIDCGDDTSLDITAAITVEAIIKADTLGAAYRAIITRDNGSLQNYTFMVNNDERLRFRIYDTGTPYNAYESAVLVTDTYYHVAGTYDGTTLNVYKNGTVGDTPVAHAGSIDNDNVSQAIGLRASDNWPVDGIIDEVRISSIDRGAAWIKATYNACWDTLVSFSTETDTWKSGWDNRIKITVDSSKIDASLEWFPVKLVLSSSCGISSEDMTRVFDEIGVEDQKIAVTGADGVTELYVDIERWDSTNEVGALWVARDGFHLSSLIDTVLYLYYDSAHADNTTYVDVSGTAVAQNVWDANAIFTSHMKDGADNQHLVDSTSNDLDFVKGAAGEPTEEEDATGYRQDLDGGDYFILDDNTLDIRQDFTFDFLFELDAFAAHKALYNRGATQEGIYIYIDGTGPDKGELLVLTYKATAGILTDSTDGLIAESTKTAISVVRSGATITIYKNGADVTENQGTHVNPGASAGVVAYMAAFNTTTYRIDGRMWETRIADVARSAAWTKALYNTLFDTLVTYSIEGESLPVVLIDVAWTTGAMADTPDWYDATIPGGHANQGCMSYHFRKGRQHQLARMQTGQADLVLKNFSGYFWPDKVQSPWYPYSIAGKKIRIRCIYNGTLYPRFVGFIDEWRPGWLSNPGENAIMTVIATDGMESVSRAVLNNAGEAQELSGTRIGNVLDEVSWPAADRDIATGVDLVIATGAQANINAMSHIDLVNASELGFMFVASNGDMTWSSRATRPTSHATPVAFFGDDEGEMGYVSFNSVIDRDLLYNEVRMTRSGGDEQTSEDTTSQGVYGKRTYVKTGLLSVLDIDVEVLCAYLVGRYKNANTLRLESLTLFPLGDASNLFPKAFGYDINTRINCRLNEANLDKDFYIEGVDERSGGDGAWSTLWQLSDSEQQEFTPGNVEETLAPTGAGDDTETDTLVGAASRWQANLTSDGDTSYAACTNNPGGGETDLFAMADSSYGKGTINSVKLTVSFKGLGGVGVQAATPKIKTGGSEFGTGITPTVGSYNTYEQTWTTNPDTSVAWTWANIAALQAGYLMNPNTAFGDSCRCSYVKLTVNLTPTW